MDQPSSSLVILQRVWVWVCVCACARWWLFETHCKLTILKKTLKNVCFFISVQHIINYVIQALSNSGIIAMENRLKKEENHVRCLRFPLSSQFWLTFFVLTTGALCPCRPAGGKSNDAGVLPGRSDIRRNSRSPFPLSNGRQRDGVHYSHHQTHERHDLDQISHGQAWVAEPVRHLRVHLAASNNPSIMI